MKLKAQEIHGCIFPKGRKMLSLQIRHALQLQKNFLYACKLLHMETITRKSSLGF